MNMRNTMLLLALSFASAMPLIGMVPPWEALLEDVKQKTEANEDSYNGENCRPFVTLTVVQTAPRYYTLENYVTQLTNNPEQKMKTDMGWYQRIDPKDWHMSLLTLALPLSDRLMKLKDDATKQGMFKAERRKYAEKALNDLSAIVASHVDAIKGLQFSYNSIGGIGTNKFIAAYFDFKSPLHRVLYLAAYADIISDFLKKYPTAWMRYGLEFLPHVSVMKKSYAAKVKKEGAVCKGSGRGMAKTPITIAPAEPVIENMAIFHNGRDIIVSGRDKGYPLSETHSKAQEFLKKGEKLVKEDGQIFVWKWDKE